MAMATAAVKTKKVNEPLIKVSEAAKRLGLNPKTVYTLIDMGQLSAVNLFAGTARRRSFRIDPAELARFIGDQTTKPAANSNGHDN